MPNSSERPPGPLGVGSGKGPGGGATAEERRMSTRSRSFRPPPRAARHSWPPPATRLTAALAKRTKQRAFVTPKAENGAGGAGSAGMGARSDGSDGEQGGGSGRDEQEQGGDDGAGRRHGNGRRGAGRSANQGARTPTPATSTGLSGPHPCACPMKQAWGSLDSLIGRLRAAYEENGGKPEKQPLRRAHRARVPARHARAAGQGARHVVREEEAQAPGRAAAGAATQSAAGDAWRSGDGGRGGDGGSSSKDQVGTFSPPAVESGVRHGQNDATVGGRGGAGVGGGLGAGSLQEQRGLGHMLGAGGNALMPMGGGQGTPGSIQQTQQPSSLLSLPLQSQQQQQRMGETHQGAGQAGQGGQGLLEQFNATLRNQLALQHALQGQAPNTLGRAQRCFAAGAGAARGGWRGLQSLPPEANLLGQLLLSQALGGGGGMSNGKPPGRRDDGGNGQQQWWSGDAEWQRWARGHEWRHGLACTHAH
ncbi:unnamed protein product [Closterium sp. NIES-64]|nr:unnamed protein product [Closterium sp. NIES-64]